MKNKKNLFIISGACLALVIAATLIFTLAGRHSSKTPEAEQVDTESTVNVGDISVENPENSVDTDDDIQTEDTDNISIETIPEGAEIISPDEKIEANVDDESTGEEYVAPAIFVTEAPAYMEDEPSEVGGGTVIGGANPDVESYNCGAEGHHCSGPETHAYILSLELEGCPNCGSHNCASFYVTDEWGNTCYTPSKCPKYDIKKDPVYYCQDCGKKSGDGKNGSCVQFVNADNCPNCGEWVEGWTCHTCK